MGYPNSTNGAVNSVSEAGALHNTLAPANPTAGAPVIQASSSYEGHPPTHLGAANAFSPYFGPNRGGAHTPNYHPISGHYPQTPSGDLGFEHFLGESSFFDSLLVSQGEAGFLPGLFRWSATGNHDDELPTAPTSVEPLSRPSSR